MFIGRLDMHHKGIDLLLNAMYSQKGYLKEAGFVLDIYGPRRYDYCKIDETIRNLGIDRIARLHDEVDFADKMSWVADHYDVALKFGEKGKELTKQEFSSLEQSKKALAFMKDIINHSS